MSAAVSPRRAGTNSEAVVVMARLRRWACRGLAASPSTRRAAHSPQVAQGLVQPLGLDQHLPGLRPLRRAVDPRPFIRSISRPAFGEPDSQLSAPASGTAAASRGRGECRPRRASWVMRTMESSTSREPSSGRRARRPRPAGRGTGGSSAHCRVLLWPHLPGAQHIPPDSALARDRGRRCRASEDPTAYAMFLSSLATASTFPPSGREPPPSVACQK